MTSRVAPTVLGLIVVCALHAGTTAAAGATLYVRSDGSDSLCDGTADESATAAPTCAFATVGKGVATATSGDTVQVGPGVFAENLTISTALTLAGSGNSGANSTVLMPAVSGPTCTSGVGSLCPGASSVVLVQSSDVTVRDLVIEGDNPTLTSGLVSDGADLDARNGIIENHDAGVFDRLKVTGVRVQNIYLRGIYPSSGGGGYSLSDNVVTNVKADPGESFCILAFGGGGVGVARGTIQGNTVSDCTGGVAAQRSKGGDYTANLVSRSRNGIQTSNTQGQDLIEGNTVSLGMDTVGATGLDGAWGALVFAAYDTQTVRNNTISGVDAGIVVSGLGTSAALPWAAVVEGNAVDLANRSGSLGVAITTQLFGWGSGSTSVSLTGNTIRGAERGILVESEDSGIPGSPLTARVLAIGNSLVENGTGLATTSDPAMTGDYVITAHANRIAGNTTAAVSNSTAATIDATDNWWGCSYGPGATGADCLSPANGVAGAGSVTASPWLVLGLSGLPPFVTPGASVPVAASVRVNSTGSDTSAVGTVKDGTLIGFSSTVGSIAASVGTVSGIANTPFAAPVSQGPGSATALLDGQSVTSSFLVATPASADVATTLAGSTSTRVGESIAYTVTVANNGPATASGAVLSLSLPAGVTFVAATGACTSLPCSLGDVASGDTRSTSVTLAVSASYSGPSPFVVTAETLATTDDPNPANNSDSETVEFFPGAVGADFYTLTPCRVLDTRSVSTGGPALAAGHLRTFVVAGACGVPISALAVALNVTITQPGAQGNVRLLPGGSPVPLASNVNYVAGATRANNAIVALGSQGDIAALAAHAGNSGTVDLILDVVGYFDTVR